MNNNTDTLVVGKPTSKSGIIIQATFNGAHIWLKNENTGETKELPQYIVKADRSGGYNEYKAVTVFGESVKVHRIVASIFCPGEAEGKVVHHRDENTMNNSADNLMWMTPSEHRRAHRGDKSRSNSLKWNWELHPHLRCYKEVEVTFPNRKKCVFDSIGKAAELAGMHRSSLSWRFKRGNGTTEINGMKFRLTKNQKACKPVVAIDEAGNERVFKSQYAAAKELGVSQGNINRCLNYPETHAYYMGSTGGYKFRYATRKEVA
jgi:hypothetical protein